MRGRAKRTFGSLLIVTIAALGPARAESATRVIELFTSQGCPQCPPADRLIADLAREPDTVALSFAVNYWDYAGWKDTLASPAFTRRQHAYATARGDGLVYTPQVIVDGLGVRPGADKAAILDDTKKLKGDRGALTVPIALTETNGTLGIVVGAADRLSNGPVGVYVARVTRAKTVEIGRGENSGRSVTYTNVVRAMSRIGEWSGGLARFEMMELKGDDEGYVVLLQTGSADKPGAILAAAKTPDL